MCHHIVTLNLDTGVYIDTSLVGWGIMDTLHQLRGLWHKSEKDHINGVKLKATVIGVWTYCSNKHYSQIIVTLFPLISAPDAC